MLNHRLETLTEYPFTRLAALLHGTAPAVNRPALSLAVGEPQRPVPDFVPEILAARAADWSRYPPVAGTPQLLAAAANWLTRRYALPSHWIDPERHLLAAFGSREALFLAALLAVPEPRPGAPRPAVCLPDPFYAPYEGAAVMAGAEPVFLPTTAETGFLPDLDALSPELLARTALVYLCHPTNPQGAVTDRAYLARLLALARTHDFVLAVDECYAEIYFDAPPPGALAVAAGMDGGALDNLLVFHTLSKRSNAAGLRSGFVAGDPALIADFRRLRGYSASAMPLPVQAASAALWDDDAHVAEIRAFYRANIDAAEAALGHLPGFRRPAAGFVQWLDVRAAAGLDGETATRLLWREQGLRLLPGAYLSHGTAEGGNPGADFVRIALVHETDLLADALARLTATLTAHAAGHRPRVPA